MKAPEDALDKLAGRRVRPAREQNISPGIQSAVDQGTAGKSHKDQYSNPDRRSHQNTHGGSNVHDAADRGFVKIATPRNGSARSSWVGPPERFSITTLNHA
jgi:hypothetical protein